jgi:hypothetical protein
VQRLIRTEASSLGSREQTGKWTIQQSTIGQTGRYLPCKHQPRSRECPKHGLGGIASDNRQTADRGCGEYLANGLRQSPQDALSGSP